jgi:hypothetical protein
MYIVTTHLPTATILAGVSSVSGHLASAASAAGSMAGTAAGTAGPAAGAAAMIVVIVVIALVAVLARAARALAEILGQFLRIASIMTGTLCTMVISAVFIVALLVRR